MFLECSFTSKYTYIYHEASIIFTPPSLLPSINSTRWIFARLFERSRSRIGDFRARLRLPRAFSPKIGFLFFVDATTPDAMRRSGRPIPCRGAMRVHVAPRRKTIRPRADIRDSRLSFSVPRRSSRCIALALFGSSLTLSFPLPPSAAWGIYLGILISSRNRHVAIRIESKHEKHRELGILLPFWCIACTKCFSRQNENLISTAYSQV